jgi:hypothetical protein
MSLLESSRHNRSPAQTICAWLIVLVLAFRAVMPLGFMPDFAAKTGALFPVKICSGLETKTITVDQNGHEAPPSKTQDKTHTTETPCSFSIGSAFAATGITPPQLLVLTQLSLFIKPPADFILAASRIFGNASPRAPPLAS